MSTIARLIFRFDFKQVCTPYVDSPGTAMDILHNAGDDIWESVGEDASKRIISGSFSRSNEIFRQIYFDPANINGSIEFISGGISSDKLARDNSFMEMDRLVAEFIRTFRVSEVARVGIRFFMVDRAETGEHNMLGKFNASLSENLARGTTETLGEINDVAAVFEGQGADEISYRATFGPLVQRDTEKHLAPKGTIDDPDKFINMGFNTLCDLDLYENDISFREFTLASWSKTKLSKADNFVEMLVSTIRE